MLKKLLVSLLVLLLLTGCGSNASGSTEKVEGDFSGETLNVFLPGEYIDEEVVAAFEEEYDVKVNLTTFASNEEMYTKLLGGTSYDILIPSDYMIEKLMSENMIKKIDKTKIPHVGDLYDGMLCDYDPNFDYSVPYFWGSVGLVYDAEKIDQKDVESQGWAVLKNPKYKGLVYMYDSERDSFMIALKSLGYSMNTHDSKELEEAYNWLVDVDNKVEPLYVTNLISAVLDNHIYQGNELNIDPAKVVWKRCLDMNDRTLRDITIAQNKKTNGVERVDHFCITVASETMAILCLSKDLKDFENKIGQAIVAYTYDDKPVTVKDLNLGGALSLVMKQAIKPNLVQTLEHTPVLVHGGPFANIAHGCNSIIATKLGLKLADYVVTEAGFGADLGAEKFMNIKCRMAGLKPSTVVLVATCRALKLHGGVAFEELDKENIDALKNGLCNLDKHLDSVNRYGVPVVVAVNRFLQDTQKEVDTLVNYLKEKGIEVAVCEGFAKGSEGAVELANKVVESCEKPSDFKFVYEDSDDLKTKIEKISKVVYGATAVEFSDLAKQKLEQFKIYNSYPVCMAKTPLSLTDDPKVLGRPKEFTIHVNDLSISNGAGFVVAYTGSIMVMPGLPKVPAACKMGIDDKGETFGLF